MEENRKSGGIKEGGGSRSRIGIWRSGDGREKKKDDFRSVGSNMEGFNTFRKLKKIKKLL